MSDSDIWRGDGKPVERIGDFEVYTDNEYEPGFHDISVFNDAYPLAMYGHYRPRRTDDFCSLAWATNNEADTARLLLHDYANRTPSGKISYQSVAGEDRRLIRGKRHFNSLAAAGSVCLQIERQNGGFMQWVKDGKSHEDYPHLPMPFLRIRNIDDPSDQWLHVVVEETIRPEFQVTARETLTMLQNTFRKYRELAH